MPVRSVECRLTTEEEGMWHFLDEVSRAMTPHLPVSKLQPDAKVAGGRLPVLLAGRDKRGEDEAITLVGGEHLLERVHVDPLLLGANAIRPGPGHCEADRVSGK
jgi:hypothetical protein